MNYVVHFCKNPNCKNCWIDKDLTNAKTIPPNWKYCPKCEQEGFINPSEPPKKERSEAQKEHFRKMQEKRNEKSNLRPKNQAFKTG